MNNLRLATLQDLDTILHIIEFAKLRLKEDGLTQWQSGNPNKDVLQKDIETKTSYVYLIDDEVAGVINISKDKDPNYETIEGSWLKDNDTYITLHRIAIGDAYKGKGTGPLMIQAALAFAKDQGFKEVRIDTHRNNNRMITLVTKLGFQYAGVIHVDDPLDSRRNAYQYFI